MVMRLRIAEEETHWSASRPLSYFLKLIVSAADGPDPRSCCLAYPFAYESVISE